MLGSFDPANYRTELVWAPARERVSRVPVSTRLSQWDRSWTGNAPLLQEGYGSYGESSDPEFSGSRLSLLDRGFVYAIAHIRGGQEMGRRWYEDGRLLHKVNTFTDFIDVTRLPGCSPGCGPPSAFLPTGLSAGGLLIGADRQHGAWRLSRAS